jgi:hypothetical protein
MTKINAKLVALTQEVRYDPLTGDLFWVRAGRGRSLTNPIRSPDKQGYLRINYDKGVFRVHKVVWYISYGIVPDLIDHINCDPSDNRLANLRMANKSTNGANRPCQKNNTSGFKGVSFRPRDSSWYVQVRQKGAYYSKHGFLTAKEAAMHYDQVAKNLFGEYAKLNFAGE